MLPPMLLQGLEQVITNSLAACQQHPPELCMPDIPPGKALSFPTHKCIMDPADVQRMGHAWTWSWLHHSCAPP